MKINLGGTCGSSKWREILIPMLNKNIEYRNPVMKDGTWKYDESVKLNKMKIMKEYNYLVYVITPEQKGFSSIASVVDYSNKIPKKVVLCILKSFNGIEFKNHQLESIKCVEDIVKDNGCMIFNNLQQVANFLNEREQLYK